MKGDFTIEKGLYTEKFTGSDLDQYMAYLSHPSIFQLDDANEAWAIVTLTEGETTPLIAGSTTLEEGAYTNFIQALPAGWETTLTNQ